MAPTKMKLLLKKITTRVKTFFRQVGLIGWKNLLLRRNQWISFIFELLFPIGGTTLVLLICSLFEFPLNTNVKVTRYEAIDESGLFPKSWCGSNSSNTDPGKSSFIAFTPNNSQTTDVIKLVAKIICTYSENNKTHTGWIPVESEAELEKMYKNTWRQSNSNFMAAVVFTDGLAELLNSGSNGGAISYKIRMSPTIDDRSNSDPDVYRFPSTKQLLPERVESDELRRNGMDDFTRIGPNNVNEERYASSGFIGLQLALDKALAMQLFGRGFKRNILLQPLPYPSYLASTNGRAVILSFIYQAYAWGLVFMFTSITRNVVGEKQTGIRELLRCSGVSSGVQLLGWIIHVLSAQLIPIVFITVFLCFPIMSKVAILDRSDWSLLFVILLLYIMASSGFGFLVCSLCRKPTQATTIALLLWIFGINIAHITIPAPHLFPMDYKIGFSVIPNFALTFLFANIIMLEESVSDDESDNFAGAQWSNVHRPPVSENDDMWNYGSRQAVSNLALMGMLFADFVVYTLLAAYFNLIIPSQHGVARPWYLFDLGRWGKSRRQAQIVPLQLSHSDSPTAGFEEDPEGIEVGVDVQGLSKRFGWRKMAVNGVFMKMFKGDIFALLGHNGAGKTTLISMLTGFITPTEGTAVISGYNIRNDLEQARESMGLCPQHNMLFERITVSEQIRLFGMLRGLSWGAAQAETNTLLSRMGFSEKRNILANKLSGGQQRKLSLAMALIGGTKVVVLDEPTSGMDPQARREIWDILLQLRGERTILLTTHFMEEADVLGDRVGIMAGGILYCCGTTAFLKKYYGTGYTLKLTLHGRGAEEAGSSNKAILAVVHQHISDANIKSTALMDKGSTRELFVTLPSETATTAALCEMFADLEARKAKLEISTIGLSQTTMDDVFVKVGEQAGDNRFAAQQDAIEMEDARIMKTPKLSKHKKIIGQFASLLVKKYIFCKRKWVALIFEVTIPLLLFVAVVHITNFLSEPRFRGQVTTTRTLGVGRLSSTTTSKQHITPLEISLDAYKDPVTLYHDRGNLSTLPGVIGASAWPAENSVSKTVILVGTKHRIDYKRKYIVAAEVNSTDFFAMFNLYPYHAAPLALNLATNSLLRQLNPNGNYRIKVTNHPFDDETASPTSRALSPSNANRKATNFLEFSLARMPYEIVFVVLISMGLIILTTNFISIPIEEKISKAKQLQTMTGVSPLIYWGAALVWDYLFYCIISLAMLAYLLVFEYGLGDGVISSQWGWVMFLLILLVYGFSSIWFSYLFSLRSNSVAGGFILLILVHFILGLLLSFILLPMESSLYEKFDQKLSVLDRVSYFVTWILVVLGRFTPTFSLVRALQLFIGGHVANTNCPILAKDPSQCDYKNYLTFNRKSGGVEVPALVTELCLIMLNGLCYLGLLMLFEYNVFKKLSGWICKESGTAFPPNIYDEDVFNEKERVNTLIASGHVGSECLVVQNLCKSFGSFAAVSQLHFGVHHGECFGLLGVNGAGKTTAFRMITGDEIPSVGNAFGFGTSLNMDTRKFFSNIGYCPQFYAFLPRFTGKEMLQLFAGLRGVPFSSRKMQAQNWLIKMGLEDSNVQCGKYSGGMMRRLGAAMAMIGDPPLILLDEPTSGVDPVSRRHFWKIIKKMNESGQSIILTSHSMDECEALCSSLGIMVNGQFQCFGGVQHLKNKFAQGYSVTLKLKPNLPFGNQDFEAELQKFCDVFDQRFQPCVLKDKHQNLLQYSVQDASMTWDVLFKTMEEIKAQFGHLMEDYSVNETSLEEVFISFAKQQYPERKANVGLCKEIFTCNC